jgi:hypothetical protein
VAAAQALHLIPRLLQTVVATPLVVAPVAPAVEALVVTAEALAVTVMLGVLAARMMEEVPVAQQAILEMAVMVIRSQFLELMALAEAVAEAVQGLAVALVCTVKVQMAQVVLVLVAEVLVAHLATKVLTLAVLMAVVVFVLRAQALVVLCVLLPPDHHVNSHLPV